MDLVVPSFSMDSVSQALWGALSSETVVRKRRGRIPPWGIGLVAGTLPDLDTFISNSNDPVFSILIHRHFSHSIFFIPVGALLVFLIFWPWIRKEKENFRYHYGLAVIGYGTHWILDVMTSYGTLIFWPLSNARYALDWISIVDPLLTIPWLAALLLLAFKSPLRIQIARAVMVYSVLYFSYAAVLHSRAWDVYSQILGEKGVAAERVRVLPTLGNSFWFRAVARTESEIHAQGLFIDPLTWKIYERPGEVRARWQLGDEIARDEVAERQIRIWQWFVDDFMYLENEDPLSIGDGRYSSRVEGFRSLWVLRPDFKDPRRTVRTQPDLVAGGEERKLFEGYALLFNKKDLVGRDLDH